MKKYLLTMIVSAFVLVLLSASDTYALPKGLEDRGPLTKQTFIHYKRSNAKPDGVGGGGGKSATKCYSFLARGARWKSTEPFVINASDSGMLASDVLSTAITSVTTWDNQVLFNIFGNAELDNQASFDFNSTDKKNVLMFGDYDANVIGVTNVWGYFSGPTQTRELVEWDMLLNTDFDWGNAEVSPSVMDLENILTHELGHALGLADQYELACEPVTMFGYSGEGETSKRALELDDIKGVQELYR